MASAAVGRKRKSGENNSAAGSTANRAVRIAEATKGRDDAAGDVAMGDREAPAAGEGNAGGQQEPVATPGPTLAARFRSSRGGRECRRSCSCCPCQWCEPREGEAPLRPMYSDQLTKALMTASWRNACCNIAFLACLLSALSYKIPVYTQDQDTTQGVDVLPTTQLPRDFEPAVDVAIVNDAVELFRWAAIVPGVSVFASVLGGCGAWRANKWCIYATLLVAFTWFHISLFVSTYPLLTSDLYSEACTTLRATCQATLDDSGWTDGRALASLASTPNLAGEGDVAVGATVITSSPDNGGLLRGLASGDGGTVPPCDMSVLDEACDGFARVVYCSGGFGLVSTLTLFFVSLQSCITTRYWKRPRLWRATMLTGKTGTVTNKEAP